MVRVLNKAGQDADDAPRNDDPRQPFAGAPDFDQIRARYLEKEISEEEYSGTEPEDLGIEAECGRHLEFGEADVDAVDKRDDEQADQKRHYPPRDPGGRCRRNIAERSV